MADEPAAPVDAVVERLTRERRRAERRLEALRGDFGEIVEASRDTNADDEHDPEGHTIAYERSQVDALIRMTERRVADLDRALELARQDGYGRCEVCGRQIPAARLEVRPMARTCVDCR